MSWSEAMERFVRLSPVEGFKALFDKSPEENIRQAVAALRTGTEVPGAQLRKIHEQLERGGHAETLTHIARLMQQLNTDAPADQIFKQIHAAVDPAGAAVIDAEIVAFGHARGKRTSISF